MNEKIPIKGIHKITIRNEKTGKIVRELEFENIITTTGRNAIAQILTGEYGSTGEITRCALGTGSTAAAIGDTTLETEDQRKDCAGNGYSSTNIAYISAYFNPTDVAGNTYEEFGYFIDGTDSADSGILLNRVVQQIVVGAGESLTIDSSFTFTT